MRVRPSLLTLAALAASLFLSACDTNAPPPDTRCPAPWLADACPDSVRVPVRPAE